MKMRIIFCMHFILSQKKDVIIPSWYVGKVCLKIGIDSPTSGIFSELI